MAESVSTSEQPPEEHDPLVGTLLNDRYQIHSVLANGGMGKIYRGEQIPLGRAVAIKVRHIGYVGSKEDPQFQKRFFLEASILSKLQHPNVVTLFDYGRIEKSDNAYFMVMEFLPGETLHRRLRARGVLPATETLTLVRQIARGLREAHRHEVVHRDLKPSNVMLVADDDGDEVVKIVDFGLVKMLAEGAEELTKDGTFLGSPRYMSPEQISHGRVDHRTDIYSLGIIMYECLCGRAPFDSEKSVHTLIAHLQQPPPPMREKNPDVAVPEELELFARRCLEKDPNARPASMEEFLRGLSDCESAMGLAPHSGRNTVPPVSGSFSGASLAAPAAIATPSTAADTTSARHDAGAVAPSVRPPVAPLPAAPAVSVAPPAPATSANTRLIYALVVVIALLALAQVLRPALTPSAAPTTASGAGAAPTSYELVIDSVPSGAQVREGSALLGATPLTLVIDNRAVQARGRRLEVRREGFAPFEVPVGASTSTSVRVIASLVAQGAPAPSPVAVYDLVLESTPAGARVFEGGVFLGMTPFTLRVDNQSLATVPRRLEVRRAGYATFVVPVSPSSSASVRVLASLVVSAPVAPRPPRREVAPRVITAPTPTPAPQPPVTAPGFPNQIRRQR